VALVTPLSPLKLAMRKLAVASFEIEIGVGVGIGIGTPELENPTTTW